MNEWLTVTKKITYNQQLRPALTKHPWTSHFTEWELIWATLDNKHCRVQTNALNKKKNSLRYGCNKGVLGSLNFSFKTLRKDRQQNREKLRRKEKKLYMEWILELFFFYNSFVVSSFFFFFYILCFSLIIRVLLALRAEGEGVRGTDLACGGRRRGIATLAQNTQNKSNKTNDWEAKTFRIRTQFG